ncbi:MAG: helix-turn-helix domain-containing protein [Clostridiaceae bacterium]
MIQKEFITSELKYRYPQMTEQIRNPRQPVKRPLFFESGMQKPGSRIYLCRPEQLEQISAEDGENALFLCAGETSGNALDYCAFPADTDLTALFNFVQRLFDRLDEWSQRLKEIAESGNDCAELLESVASMLQNPVWICDERWHVIARAERFFPEEGLEAFLPSYNMLEEKARCLPEGTTIRLGQPVDIELLGVSLQAGGARFTLVCAARERPFYASDETVFAYLTGYVKLMLSERKTSVRALRPNREFDVLERNLRGLFEETLSMEAAMEAMLRLNWTEEADYLVFAAEPQNGDMRENLANGVCDRLEYTLPDCCAFPLLSVVAAVVRLSDGNREEPLRQIESFAVQNGLRFGVSEPLAGFTRFPQRLKQARFCLDQGKRKDAGITRFCDAADDFFLQGATAVLPPELICLRAVQEMAKSDREHDTNYLETAERYIRNKFNAVKTAGELFIHRSTFLYRLERMKTQFGLDLDAEQPSLLWLLLSIQLISRS